MPKHRRLEGYARAQRGVEEQHRQHAPGELRWVGRSLQLRCAVEDTRDANTAKRVPGTPPYIGTIIALIIGAPEFQRR